MKKTLLTSAAFILGLSAVTPAFANGVENQQTENQVNYEESVENQFTYVYNGVEFTGNIELTDDQLAGMYRNVVSPEPTITPMANDSGGSYRSEISPIYKTYKNTVAKATATAMITYFASKVPKAAKDTKSVTWLTAVLTAFAVDKTSPTYVGGWVSSSYNSAKGYRVYTETVTHYKNSNYTSPKKVQYYDVTHWYR